MHDTCSSGTEFDTMWRRKQSPFLMFMSFIKNEVEALIYVTGDC